MQPMNYTLDVQKPFESALGGIQAGLALSGAMDKQAEQQRQIALQKQMQLDLANLSRNPNPTATDFAQITTRYPQLAEHFKNTWSMLNSDQQQNKLSQATQIYAALNAGQPDVAQRLAAEQAAALRNSGQERDAGAMDTLSKLIGLHPETAKTSTGLLLSSILGPEKFATTFSTLAKLPGEVAKGEAEAGKATYEAANTPERLALENLYKGSQIKDLDSQIADRAGKLKLDRDKLQSETELKLYELNQKANPAFNLGDDAKKIINESTVASVAADQSSGQMIDLANRIEREGLRSGVTAKGGELYKKIMGNQDAVTQLRLEYTRLRNSQVMKSLPPGSASDKDVAFAVKGFPDDTADPGTMASFLRGMAKINQYASATEQAKAEWVNAVGHMGKPKADIVVDGVNVPAGSTFVDFARQYMDAATAKRAAQQAQKALPTRSYMRWATGQITPGQEGQ